MGAIHFTQSSVEVRVGRPSSWFCEKGAAKCFSRSSDRGNTVPPELGRVHRALDVAPPPEELIVALAGQVNLKDEVAVLFGSGQRGSTEYEWCPTDILRDDGSRGWLLAQRWKEGGGDNWFGDPIYRDWKIAGAYLKERELQEWADRLFDHPLGRLVETMQWRWSPLYLPVGAQPQTWPDVEVLAEKFHFLDSDDGCVERGETPQGVHRYLRVRWHKWEGTLWVPCPHLRLEEIEQ